MPGRSPRAACRSSAGQVRSLRASTAPNLAMLPRLPDTADELKSIALALQADPSKVLKLGKDANEEAVKTMDLSGFKVLAFATHGLVPGELNGLTQPALALSAPAVAGVGGDGLLTMEEILTLEARCRLGGAVGLQHRRGSGSRRGSRLGPWPRILLCGHARAAGHQLVGSFAIGARTRHQTCSSGRRTIRN